MNVINMPTGELIPYENNTKIHPPEQVEHIANSIKRFGWQQPIVIDKNKVVIIGHGRLLAAKQMGLQEVPVVYADDLSEEDAQALRLADNKLNESPWDFTKLEEELAQLAIDGIDMSEFGFDVDIGGGITETDITEDEIPEPPTEPIAKRGDIWQLGRHRLMCGDAISREDVETLLNGKKPDMVFTDPPYELKTKGGGILKTANSMKQIRQNGVDTFDPMSLAMWGKTNVFFHNKPLIKKYIELAEANEMPYDLGFYKKTNTAPNYKGHLMTDVEYIAIIGEQDPNKGLEKEMYSKCFIGQKDNDNELSYSKPVAICAKYIRLYSNDSVLDLFGGSGSTLIACEQLGRDCFMMELDPKYVDVIIQRWQNLTGETAVLLNADKA